MIKAILFDMDGVLIDTEKYLTKFWQQACQEAGLELDITDCYMFRSYASKYASVEFGEKFGTQYDYFAIRQRRKELMKAHLEANGIEIKPEVKETLQLLREKGYQTAVVTATDEIRARQYLTEIGIYDWFDSVICATMVERGKPFPDVYLYACQQIGCEPENCIAVEDSPNGVRSASDAGCRTIMVPDLTQPDEECRKRVIGVASSLKGILAYLERLEKVQRALDEKHISFQYTQEDGCGSIDFEFRGLRYHVWEFHEDDIWGAETNVFEAGRSRDVEGDYEEIIAEEIRSWPEMAF